jgi:hypothetical protein
MVIKSRAGTIFQRRDSASQKKRGTIFVDDKKQDKQIKVIHADKANRSAQPKSQTEKLEYEGKKSTPPPILDPQPIETDTPPRRNDGRSPPAVELTQPSRTLEEIKQTTARVIYRVKTIFPFVLFPDEIIADEEKVSVIIGSFYKSGYLRSVMLKDISTVSIDTSLFFATLTIIDRNYIQDAMVVRYLKKEEAFRMRRILTGLIIANQNKVNLSAYPIDKLTTYVEEIGASRSQDTYNI